MPGPVGPGNLETDVGPFVRQSRLRSKSLFLWPVFSAAVMAVCFLPGCDAIFGGSQPRAIGVILPFTSGRVSGAEWTKVALELAIEASGEEVRLIFKDDGGQPARTAELVHELVTELDVIAIVGGLTSPCALAAAERAESLGVPFITHMATNADITRNREWTFQLCFTDPQQAARMARHAWGPLKLRRVAICRDVQNDYSIGLADAFASTFLEQGGEVGPEFSLHSGLAPTAALQDWFAASDCDSIYLPLYSTDLVTVMDALAPLLEPRDTTILGADAWHSSTSQAYLSKSTIANRIVITSHFTEDREDDEVQAFLKLHQIPDENGQIAPPTAVTALGHDLGLLLVRMLQEEPETREAARDAIRKVLSDFTGATGRCSLEKGTRELRKDVSVLFWGADHWQPWTAEQNR